MNGQAGLSQLQFQLYILIAINAVDQSFRKRGFEQMKYAAAAVGNPAFLHPHYSAVTARCDDILHL